MDQRVDALRRWQALDADRSAVTPADRLLNDCEAGLASTLLRDWSRADASIAAALAVIRGAPGPKDLRAERAVVLLRVQSLLARGDVTQATAALAPYAADASRPVLLLTAQAALAASPAAAPGNPLLKARAAELQTWVALHPRDSLAWTSLGQLESVWVSRCARCGPMPRRGSRSAITAARSTACRPGSGARAACPTSTSSMSR